MLIHCASNLRSFVLRSRNATLRRFCRSKVDAVTRLEQAALEQARRVTAIANAMIDAQDHDALLAARGLLVCATILVEDDSAAHTVRASEMLEVAREWDPHLVSARWQ